MASGLAPAASVSGPPPLSTEIMTNTSMGELVPLEHGSLKKTIQDMKKIKSPDIFFRDPDGRETRLLITTDYAIATPSKPMPQIVDDNKLNEILIKRHPSLQFWLQSGGKRRKTQRGRRKRPTSTRKH